MYPSSPAKGLTRARLHELNQVAAQKPFRSHLDNSTTPTLRDIRKDVYALAWSLNRIGKEGHEILHREGLVVVGPNDVQPSESQTRELEELNELSFWENKLRCLEGHKETIKLHRVKGWVYKKFISLWKLGDRGRRVLRRAQLSYRGHGEVQYDPRSDELEPGLNDQLAFWEHTLQHLEMMYTTLHQEEPNSMVSAEEFPPSESEEDPDEAFLFRAKEYSDGWEGRVKGIKMWIGSAAAVTENSSPTVRDREPQPDLKDIQRILQREDPIPPTEPREHTATGNASLSQLQAGKRKRTIREVLEAPEVVVGRTTKRLRTRQLPPVAPSASSVSRRAKPIICREKPGASTTAAAPSNGPMKTKILRQLRRQTSSANISSSAVQLGRHSKEKQTPTVGLRRSDRIAAKALKI